MSSAASSEPPQLYKQKSIEIKTEETFNLGRGQFPALLAPTKHHLFVGINQYMYGCKNFVEVDFTRDVNPISSSLDCGEIITQLALSRDRNVIAFSQNGGLTVMQEDKLIDLVIKKNSRLIRNQNDAVQGNCTKLLFSIDGRRLTAVIGFKLSTYDVVEPEPNVTVYALEFIKTWTGNEVYDFDITPEGLLAVATVHLHQVIVLNAEFKRMQEIKLPFMIGGSHRLTKLNSFGDGFLMVWAHSRQEGTPSRNGYVDKDGDFHDLVRPLPSNPCRFTVVNEASFGNVSVVLFSDAKYPQLLSWAGGDVKIPILTNAKKVPLMPHYSPISMAAFRHNKGLVSGHVLVLCADLQIHSYKIVNKTAVDQTLYKVSDKSDVHDAAIKALQGHAADNSDERLQEKFDTFMAARQGLGNDDAAAVADISHDQLIVPQAQWIMGPDPDEAEDLNEIDEYY